MKLTLKVILENKLTVCYISGKWVMNWKYVTCGLFHFVWCWQILDKGSILCIKGRLL